MILNDCPAFSAKRMLAALSYPNVAAIHGLEHSDGVGFLIVELVSGGPQRSSRERIIYEALVGVRSVCVMRWIFYFHCVVDLSLRCAADSHCVRSRRISEAMCVVP